jgi:hypothetical protein
LGIALAAMLAAGRGVGPAASSDPPGIAVADSNRSTPQPMAGAGEQAAPDSLAVQVDSLYSRAVVEGRGLAPRDLRVLGELLAAAREMQAAKDLEAAAVLVQDALDFIAERRP